MAVNKWFLGSGATLWLQAIRFKIIEDCYSSATVVLIDLVLHIELFYRVVWLFLIEKKNV